MLADRSDNIDAEWTYERPELQICLTVRFYGALEVSGHCGKMVTFSHLCILMVLGPSFYLSYSQTFTSPYSIMPCLQDVY